MCRQASPSFLPPPKTPRNEEKRRKTRKTKLRKWIVHIFGHNSAPVSRIGTKLGGNEAFDRPKLPIQSRARRNEEKRRKTIKTKLRKLIFHVFGHNSVPVTRIGTKLGGNEALDLPKLPIQSRARKNEEKRRKTIKTKINFNKHTFFAISPTLFHAQTSESSSYTSFSRWIRIWGPKCRIPSSRGEKTRLIIINN